MSKPFASVYIDIICASVARSEAFFSQLGWTRNEVMSEPEKGIVCLEISTEVGLMLVPREAWAMYVPEGRSVADPNKTLGGVVVIPAQSGGEEAQAFLDKVAAAGGKVDAAQPMETDGGRRHMRSWTDLDGNFFGVGWKDN